MYRKFKGLEKTPLRGGLFLKKRLCEAGTVRIDLRKGRMDPAYGR